MFFSTKTIASLAASLLLAGSAQAAPIQTSRSVAPRNMGAGKRILLWDWTNTRDIVSYPTLQSTASSVEGSAEIKAVINWDTWTPTEVPSNIAFQPMVRTPSQLSGDPMNQIVAAISGQSSPVVHFYNEPERQGISAYEAAISWKQVMLPLRSSYGAKLVSPAPASDGGGSAWISEFMGYLSDGERPDYIGVHFYTSQDQPSSVEVAAAKSYIQGQYNSLGEAYGAPVIISEVASINRDGNEVNSFTYTLSEWLDQQPWVYQYGFFGASREVVNDYVSPAAQLLDSNGSWTSLGAYLAGLA